MLTFDQFKQLMEFETKGKYCIEILFSIAESEKFDYCWMGKTPDEDTTKDIYWFGLTADGKNAFEYSTFEELSSANVFDGKAIIDIWDNIIVKEIDGCDPEERIWCYI